MKALLTAALLVLLVRTFAVTSCTIPSTGMENSLFPGERVLVNKWSYGLRLPFSTLRWAKKPARRGDIVLFNNPAPRVPQTAVGNREVFISRVAGAPGDTLMMDDELLATGDRTPHPDSKSIYAYPHAGEELLQEAMRAVHITDNRLVGYADGRYLRSFSHYEYYLLDQKLAGRLELVPLRRTEEGSHPFVVPARGRAVKVQPWNVTLLCNTIVRHEGKRASVKGDTLYVEGKPATSYAFSRDYYWMAANNPVNLCDSRLFGLVPDTHLIGRAWRVWFSPREGRFFQEVR